MRGLKPAHAEFRYSCTMHRYFLFLVAMLAFAQNDRDFAGTWLLSRPLSDLRDLPQPADEKMVIHQDAKAMTVDTDAGKVVYGLDGKAAKSKFGDLSYNIVTKWEG